MRKSPITVQQWVDTLPPARSAQSDTTNAPIIKNSYNRLLSRDLSFQSEDESSHCSSVESVLELRKPDPEAVLLELGFGPKLQSSNAYRIPSRFLHPSEILPNIDFNKFLEEYGQQVPDHQQSATSSPAKPRPKSH